MATNLPVWIGNKGLNEHPTSPKIVQDSTKTTVTRIYEGPIGVCQSAQPTMGQVFSDLPGDVVVVGSECAPGPGGQYGAKGRLTITLETPYATTYETEWVEVDRPLILNPRYWDASTPDVTPAGPMPLTLQDKSMIEKWEQEENPILKLAFQYKVPLDSVNTGTGSAAPTGTCTVNGVAFNTYTLSTQAQDYAKKRLKGEETYRLYAPVVRQTSESLDPPDPAPAGLLQTPPPDANAPTSYTDDEGRTWTYVYQQSAKRITRTGPYGKYRLQLEWQGANQIDSDLYGTADPATAPNPTS